MLCVNAKISDIHLADIVISSLEDWLESKAEDKGAVTGFFAGVLKKSVSYIPQNGKLKILLTIIKMKKQFVLDKLNELLKENQIAFFLEELHIEGDINMLKLKINIDNIEYEKLLDEYLPVLMENNETVKDISNILGDSLISCLKAALAEITDDKKEEVLIYISNKYNSEISNIINAALLKNSISCTISDFEIN